MWCPKIILEEDRGLDMTNCLELGKIFSHARVIRLVLTVDYESAIALGGRNVFMAFKFLKLLATEDSFKNLIQRVVLVATNVNSVEESKVSLNPQFSAN